MQRLLLYLTYDRQNIIDNYIGYFLQSMRPVADTIAVVCNMPRVESGLQNLLGYADYIFYRENRGLDAGGWKEALCALIGWEKAAQYDELILANDSFYGPFTDMKRIFAEMENRELDFWGLASYGGGGESLPEHIQSYFLVVRSKMLHSNSFKDYWEELPFYENFSQAVYQHEVKFTSHFEKLGYTWGVLADIEKNNSTRNPANNYMQYALLSYELIKKRNFPFLKKQQIAYNTLARQTQENLSQAIRYIDKNTDYDVNLIWENLIRTMHMADLQRSLHLQYIIPSAENTPKGKGSIAIVIFAEHREAAEDRKSVV